MRAHFQQGIKIYIWPFLLFCLKVLEKRLQDLNLQLQDAQSLFWEKCILIVTYKITIVRKKSQEIVTIQFFYLILILQLYFFLKNATLSLTI